MIESAAPLFSFNYNKWKHAGINIFSFWDRLFGTYVKVKNKKLIYGLDTHMTNGDVNEVMGMLKVPFTSYPPSLMLLDIP